MQSFRPKQFTNKTYVMIVMSGIFALIIIIKLFQLQVLAHSYYQEIATREQMGYAELPAQRGEIIIKDHHSNEEFLLATNTTLNLVYVDPVMISDPNYVTEQLEPLLFDLEEERKKDNEKLEDLAKNLPPETTEEQKQKLLTPKNDEELKQAFKENLLKQISEKQREKILLGDIDEETQKAIKDSSIQGITIEDGKLYAYPKQINNIEDTAKDLGPLIETPTKKLTTILKGNNRYVILKKKLDPSISKKIQELVDEDKKRKEDDRIFTGVGMQEEYYRFYPEGSLAANIIGYVTNNLGQYGIEKSFNEELKGIPGKFQTKKDSVGRQLTVGDSILEPAVDGDTVVLTIDRSIQLKADAIIAEAVNQWRADSGQIVVMDPKTGKVLALSHYPTFDPNIFGEAFKKTEIKLSSEEIAALVPTKEEGVYYRYINPTTKERFQVFEQKDKTGNKKYYRYENLVGPEVYHNKAIAWPYEPGSVFKSIAMAIGIDDGDVTPNTTYNDSGPVGVDWNPYKNDYDFHIKNSTGFHGVVDMTTVLAKSLNTGMTFIAKKIGPALFYSYMEKFGFLDRTGIELADEISGQIEYFDQWTESELAAHSFGQGITVNMIQMANAYCVLANGGILMQPHIIEEIRKENGRVTTTEPQQIRRVLSEDTASKMTAMLQYSAESGEARKGQVAGHYVAGKTGTSQTVINGQYQSATGTTIATYGGYGPIDDPKFVILVKLDKPKVNQWGSETSAVAFSKLAEYLFEYYNIPPDK